MYIKTTKEVLLKAVTTAMRAVPSKASAPIMETLLFFAVPGGFAIDATDGDILITTYSGAEADGSACISAKTIAELVKVLPDGDVTIEADGKTAKVSWASGHSEIPTYDTKDFPDIHLSDGDESIFDAREIGTAIGHVLPHVATDILRPQLTGVHFQTFDGKTDVVGTDSHTVCVCPVEGTVPRPFTISAKSAAIVRDSSAEADKVKVVATDSRIAFVCGNVAVSTSEIVGKFPDYRRIIPASNANTLSADIRSLSQQIRRVAICSNKASNHIRLDLGILASTVFAQDLGFGTLAKETLDVDYAGEDLSIGFKYDFLLKSIGVFDGDKVEIRFSDARHAVLVTSEGDPTICVVMPVAI